MREVCGIGHEVMGWSEVREVIESGWGRQVRIGKVILGGGRRLIGEDGSGWGKRRRVRCVLMKVLWVMR